MSLARMEDWIRRAAQLQLSAEEDLQQAVRSGASGRHGYIPSNTPAPARRVLATFSASRWSELDVSAAMRQGSTTTTAPSNSETSSSSVPPRLQPREAIHRLINNPDIGAQWADELLLEHFLQEGDLASYHLLKNEMQDVHEVENLAMHGKPKFGRKRGREESNPNTPAEEGSSPFVPYDASADHADDEDDEEVVLHNQEEKKPLHHFDAEFVEDYMDYLDERLKRAGLSAPSPAEEFLEQRVQVMAAMLNGDVLHALRIAAIDDHRVYPNHWRAIAEEIKMECLAHGLREAALSTSNGSPKTPGMAEAIAKNKIAASIRFAEEHLAPSVLQALLISQGKAGNKESVRALEAMMGEILNANCGAYRRLKRRQEELQTPLLQKNSGDRKSANGKNRSSPKRKSESNNNGAASGHPAANHEGDEAPPRLQVESPLASQLASNSNNGSNAFDTEKTPRPPRQPSLEDEFLGSSDGDEEIPEEADDIDPRYAFANEEVDEEYAYEDDDDDEGQEEAGEEEGDESPPAPVSTTPLQPGDEDAEEYRTPRRALPVGVEDAAGAATARAVHEEANASLDATRWVLAQKLNALMFAVHHSTNPRLPEAAAEAEPSAILRSLLYRQHHIVDGSTGHSVHSSEDVAAHDVCPSRLELLIGWMINQEHRMHRYFNFPMISPTE